MWDDSMKCATSSDWASSHVATAGTGLECHIIPIGTPMGPTTMLSAIFFCSGLSTP